MDRGSVFCVEWIWRFSVFPLDGRLSLRFDTTFVDGRECIVFLVHA